MSQCSGDISPGEPLVLIGEDDDIFRSFLEYALRKSGFGVLTASDGETLIEQAEERNPDVVLFESRLPGIETRALCTRLRVERRTRETAIVVLTAGSDDEDCGEFIRSGADECVAKPFSPEELIARIHAALRNTSRIDEAGPKGVLSFADLEMDMLMYRVRRNGRTIHLAPTEFRLLRHLMLNPHKVYSRDELQNAAWRRNVHLGPRTVDVHMGRLRNALRRAGGRDLIRTVRSVGYSLSD